MSKNYEFRYQSPKQKAILVGLKLVVLTFMALFLQALIWDENLSTLPEQLGALGSLFVAIWIYANLSRVKVEVPELFVPPFDNLFMIEFALLGAVLQACHLGSIIWWIIDYHFF